MVESHLPKKCELLNDASVKKPGPDDTGSESAHTEEGEAMEVETNSQQALDVMCADDIKEHAKLIEKSMITKETRFLNRVLRALMSLRTKLNVQVLHRAITICCQSDPQGRNELLFLINKSGSSGAAANIGTGGGSAAGGSKRDLKFSAAVMMEIEAYLNLLIVIFHIDNKNLQPQGLVAAKAMVDKVQSTNNRATDPLTAKCFFYFARVHELCGTLNAVRDDAHSYLRSCMIHHKHEAAAVLINTLLRIYLFENQYEFAWNFIEKTTFPKEASNNEVARHLYYMGRIKAVKLDYSAAQKDLMEALRKAPQKVAIGFRQQVQKLACVVNLLLGEIPERSIFQTAQYKKPLEPYLMLTRAVRTGNLEEFKQVSSKYKEKFIKDGTFMLIGRLRHNVIKAGIKRINASYSCISLQHIAEKLTLDSENDALYTVAKAIKDNVIEARIDYDQRWVQSLENVDIYSTLEPTMQYQARIAFMIDIHKQCTLALRYPPKLLGLDANSAEDEKTRRQREAADLEELAEELEDEDDDDDLFP